MQILEAKCQRADTALVAIGHEISAAQIRIMQVRSQPRRPSLFAMSSASEKSHLLDAIVPILSSVAEMIRLVSQYTGDVALFSQELTTLSQESFSWLDAFPEACANLLSGLSSWIETADRVNQSQQEISALLPTTRVLSQHVDQFVSACQLGEQCCSASQEAIHQVWSKLSASCSFLVSGVESAISRKLAAQAVQDVPLQEMQRLHLEQDLAKASAAQQEHRRGSLWS
jgi:hypothetical protein